MEKILGMKWRRLAEIGFFVGLMAVIVCLKSGCGPAYFPNGIITPWIKLPNAEGDDQTIINGNGIATPVITADEGNFDEVNAEEINVEVVNADTVVADVVDAGEVDAEVVNADEVVIDPTPDDEIPSPPAPPLPPPPPPVLPVVVNVAGPESVESGKQFTIVWSSTGANYCEGSGELSGVFLTNAS